jgi:hypothetical protein
MNHSLLRQNGQTLAPLCSPVLFPSVRTSKASAIRHVGWTSSDYPLAVSSVFAAGDTQRDGVKELYDGRSRSRLKCSQWCVIESVERACCFGCKNRDRFFRTLGSGNAGGTSASKALMLRSQLADASPPASLPTAGAPRVLDVPSLKTKQPIILCSRHLLRHGRTCYTPRWRSG